jgi:hypothetical protein
MTEVQNKRRCVAEAQALSDMARTIILKVSNLSERILDELQDRDRNPAADSDGSFSHPMLQMTDLIFGAQKWTDQQPSSARNLVKLAQICQYLDISEAAVRFSWMLYCLYLQICVCQ